MNACVHVIGERDGSGINCTLYPEQLGSWEERDGEFDDVKDRQRESLTGTKERKDTPNQVRYRCEDNNRDSR